MNAAGFGLWIALALPHAQEGPAPESPTPETFGCEANPTGDPIGGGPGYRDVRTGGDLAVRTAEAFLAALRTARAGQVIFIPDGAEIDLTGSVGVAIPGGVTIAGTRGHAGSDGARILTRRKATYPLFATAGDGVRITGLRLEGPTAGREQIPELACLIVTTHHGLEIDNCEVYNWNYAGIAGRRGASRLRVHHASIHHCQIQGLGYGVTLDACDARIIANRFDWCRHHIAATGRPGCAYEAAYNLVLPHANGHAFDMHGGRDRGDGTDIAGDWMEIHHNTFQSPQAAVVIRGVPSQGAAIHHNWFADPKARSVATGGNTRVFRNARGPEKRLEE
ncbi:MAG: right-handed parallel beta-helix repeat-containing protein [Planctomycetes bacterium]|nr:right-handed parallel beta-helix repeat-containing protein [Planctomycetota bacterium]